MQSGGVNSNPVNELTFELVVPRKVWPILAVCPGAGPDEAARATPRAASVRRMRGLVRIGVGRPRVARPTGGHGMSGRPVFQCGECRAGPRRRFDAAPPGR